jgi:hypothetical protein
VQSSCSFGFETGRFKKASAVARKFVAPSSARSRFLCRALKRTTVPIRCLVRSHAPIKIPELDDTAARQISANIQFASNRAGAVANKVLSGEEPASTLKVSNDKLHFSCSYMFRFPPVFQLVVFAWCPSFPRVRPELSAQKVSFGTEQWWYLL